ncbi:MAG: hypothetical protein H6737_32010 [Alphaproteobacteria bacterium]|nr:hypothetical protein [Alphaproteobacteria bacterium]
MATGTCAMCGKTVDEAKLLFSDEGRICGPCELELGDRETEANTQWTAAVGGPLMAFTAGIFLCAGFFPVIGLLTAAMAPFLSIVAIVLGVNAFLKAGEADGGIRTLLVVSGGLSVPAGIAILATSVLLVLTQLLALAG